LLEGDLGAGKTTFVKAFCDVIGIEEPISSPTFTIVNVYEGKGVKVNHLDLYRLKNATDLEDIGFDEIITDDAYIFIEWPELALPLIQDADYLLLNLEHAPNNTRNISAKLHQGI
jgi:tRNA threonylcarbamoyladenosine biosynthesis protein TsaE